MVSMKGLITRGNAGCRCTDARWHDDYDRWMRTKNQQHVLFTVKPKSTRRRMAGLMPLIPALGAPVPSMYE